MPSVDEKIELLQTQFIDFLKDIKKTDKRIEKLEKKFEDWLVEAMLNQETRKEVKNLEAVLKEVISRCHNYMGFKNFGSASELINQLDSGAKEDYIPTEQNKKVAKLKAYHKALRFKKEEPKQDTCKDCVWKPDDCLNCVKHWRNKYKEQRKEFVERLRKIKNSVHGDDFRLIREWIKEYKKHSE